MGRNLLKSMVVLAALAVLVLVPVVEANYMIGQPYVGTTPKEHEARRWALSGFYEGREMAPEMRDRSVKGYLIGGSQGRAWRSSILGADGKTSYGGMRPLMTGMRCLGCELGTYDLMGMKQRRGRYYYSTSRVSGRSKFMYTGDRGMTSRLTTYGMASAGTGGMRMLPRRAAMRSRLTISEKDLALLHEEAETMLNGYELRSGRRCLQCEYEPGKRLGRYYATSPEVQEVRSYVPLQ